MSIAIKGGTVVTADLTHRADVLVENGRIVAVGPDLSGDEVIDVSGAYVMPGGIDPHTHLEMPFMGTFSSDDFDTGTAAALAGGTTMVVDFCLPAPNQSLIEALQDWHQKAGKARTDYSFHMAITWWGKQVFDEMPEVVSRGINTFKHFMAYKGALMVNDDEMFASFQRCAALGALPLVHAENGDIVAALQQSMWSERADRHQEHEGVGESECAVRGLGAAAHQQAERCQLQRGQAEYAVQKRDAALHARAAQGVACSGRRQSHDQEHRTETQGAAELSQIDRPWGHRRVEQKGERPAGFLADQRGRRMRRPSLGKGCRG